METDIKKKLARNWFRILQDMICFDIEEIEKNKKKFISNHWERSKKKDEGGGEYRILENGKVFEKVGEPTVRCVQVFQRHPLRRNLSSEQNHFYFIK